MDQTERPDVCPKEHPIWWFDSNYYGSWGVCSGDLARCQTVWFWPNKDARQTLQPLENYSTKRLVHYVREYAKILGHLDA
jgi:hypothetical protein